MAEKKRKIIKGLFILIICIIICTHAYSNTAYGRLTGVNWFGFETANYVVHGVWARDYKSVLKQIADLGFNCIRLPWCNEMLNKTPTSVQINEYGTDAYTGETGLNLDLEGLSSLEVMDKIIQVAGEYGLYIILDNHSRAADGYMNETLWYTSGVSESRWISDWEMMVKRYRDYSNVIAVDLNNEPHGTTGSGMKPPASWGYNVEGYGNTDWRAAAIKAGQAVLSINPDLLVIIEGVEEYPRGEGYWWGGNLQGVRDYPITTIPSRNLVYSAHEYGSSVFKQTWFSAPDFPNNLYAIWDKQFNFVELEGIAPLFIGEFGITDMAADTPGSTDYVWLSTFMKYVGSRSSWTFWCMNPNSGDTGGILKQDWVTVNQSKMDLLRPYLAKSGETSPPVNTPTPTPEVTDAPTPTSEITPMITPEVSELGDVNDDGIVNIVDALLVAKYYVDKTVVLNEANADVDCNSAINIIDALLIAQFYVKIINNFC
ncbi:MAG: cellulase family glycosylhydrolase [Spirochaetales bacterium]|nr:cellulase family glycosylhydrolase [Spirochaetales bacterium]